jgi:hypothetical protein
MKTGREIFPVVKVWDKTKKKWNKRPAVRGSWQGYEATAAEIDRSENLGLGIPAGRVVVDVDAYKGTTTDQIDAALGVTLDWDGARIQRTVSGGEHYCFVLPEGAVVRQGDSLLGVSGFDTRATGKGWICSGDGYEDLTVLGLPDALWEEDFPVLPMEAVEAINGKSGVAVVEDEGFGDDGLSGLEVAIASQPLDGIGDAEIQEYLDRLGDEYLTTYDKWVKVGMAIHHQVGGAVRGANMWAAWSRQCDERELCNAEGRRVEFDGDEIKRKWHSFGQRSMTKPVRFDYVIAAAGGRLREVAAVGDQTLFEDVLQDARSVDGVEAYQRLKERVGRLGVRQLPPDLREMIAKEVWDIWAKGAGVALGQIKRAFAPGKVKREVVGEPDADGEVQRPAWLKDWVYIERPTLFYSIDKRYGIKREAFNAKFDRMPEVIMAEKRAADYALVDMRLQTVVDDFYFPGAADLFEYEDKLMVNSYIDRRVEPLDVWDDEALELVALFEGQMAMLFSDAGERGIVLDWMTYVINNPGKRINWALFIQGAEGIGKSYVVNTLQYVMRDAVKTVEASAISGRFTSWAHGSLVVAVEEIRISGQNKWEVIDRLKPFITNDTIQIEEKGRDHRVVANFSSFIFLSNHKDAIPLVEGDRRYAVIFSDIQTQEQLFAATGGREEASRYFDRLFALSQKRPDALRRYFMDRKVSPDFRPQGRAPETKAKAIMREMNVSPEQNEVEDAIDKHDCAIISKDVVDVTWLRNLCDMENDPLPQKRALSKIMERLGYELIEGRRIRIAKTKVNHYIYRTPNVTDGQARQIVRQFHDEPDEIAPF